MPGINAKMIATPATPRIASVTARTLWQLGVRPGDVIQNAFAYGLWVAGLSVQPCRGETTQTGALGGAQPGQGLLVCAERPALARAPSLYLDERQRVPVERDQVDLSVARADVARDDRETETLQVRRRQTLAETAELATGVGDVLGRWVGIDWGDLASLLGAWDGMLDRVRTPAVGELRV